MSERSEPREATVLQLRRPPRVDGPFDDEPDAPRPVRVEGNLALAFPASTVSAMPLRLVPPAMQRDPQPASARLLDPRRLIGPVAQAIAEVLAGYRPPQQLAQVATLDVLTWLERSAGRMAPRGTGVPVRPRVTSIRLCEPRRGVAEVAAVIDTGRRSRAMALRLEATNARWRLTVVRVG